MCSTIKVCSYGNIFNGKNKKSFSVNSILPGELAQALQTNCSDDIKLDQRICNNTYSRHPEDNVMLLDCRSFLAYNFKHITGAFNVNCTGIGKKRLQQGKASLVDLVTCEYGKEFLRSGKWAKAVVYDESTSELEKTPPSHPVKLVLASLTSQGKEALLLKGGLKEFSQCYQNLLAVQSSDQTGGVSNAIDRINSLARYQQEIAASQPGCPLNVRATEIMSSVFLGNSMDAADEHLLQENNIRYILNLTCNCPNYFSKNSSYHYKQIKIEDSCCEDIREIIAEAIEFIDLAKTNNASVLIHCQGGVSRSPTVTIAYLMHLNKLSLKEAYEFVKNRRPCIAPNLNFMGQLLEMEQRRNGRNTCSIATRSEFLKKLPLCGASK